MKTFIRFLHQAYHLYYDGFRSMTLGKTLWTVILIKLVIIFAVLKLFFFPDFIGSKADKGEEPEFVSEQILRLSPALSQGEGE